MATMVTRAILKVKVPSPGVAVIDTVTADELLAVAEAEPDRGVRLAIVRSLVQLGLAVETWEDVGARARRLVDLPAGDPGRGEALGILARIPTAEATARLREVARDPDAPDSLTAAFLLDSSPAPSEDLVEGHVPGLVDRLRQGTDPQLLGTLARLRLDRYAVDPAVFEPALADANPDVRFWAAVCLAKLGRTEPLRHLVSRLLTETPSFLWGSPWAAYDEMAAAAPMPPAVREVLASWWEDVLDRDGRLVIGALTGLWDAEGAPIERVAGPSPGGGADVEPPAVAVEDDLADRLVDAARRRDLSALPAHDLVACTTGRAEDVTAVATEVLYAFLDMAAGPDGWAWGNAASTMVSGATRPELPVADLLDRFVTLAGDHLETQVLGAALARTDPAGAVTAMARSLRHSQGETRRKLASLLDTTSWFVQTGAVPVFGSGGSGAPRPEAPLVPSAPQVEQGTGEIPPVPPPPPTAQPPVPPQATPSDPPALPPPVPTQAVPESVRRRRWRWSLPGFGSGRQKGKGSGRREHIELALEQDGPVLEIDAATKGRRPAMSAYEAWPQLEAPDVVVARTAFEVTIGLGQDYDPMTNVTGTVTIESPLPAIDFEVEILVDPKSFTVAGEPARRLRVSADDPYPTVTFSVSAATAPGLLQERTIRALYRREGRIVGVAARNVVVVTAEAQVPTAPRPRPIEGQMLDLKPLLDDAPPDLVVTVCTADEPGTYVWDVFPLHGTTHLADTSRRTTIDSGARDFATHVRRTMSSDQFRGVNAFDQLKGYGDIVQATIPSAVRQVLRDLLAGRDKAPSVLFLTEETFVPWEIAVLDPPVETSYGGRSPFLGAHLAMSRWPLAPEATPTPAARLSISSQGVLTAAYDGVQNWKRLPAAEAEALAFDKAYGPSTLVAPRLEDVRACLEGRVAVDLLHVALHGQYDPTLQEDGLVLLEPDGEGYKASFLTSNAVRGYRNDVTKPFVFLNACQVGAGDSVLGSYAGFAAALLRARACGVVAPLWNVDDKVAAGLSARFYAAAYGPERVPVAEILRRFRAEYVRDAVAASPEQLTPTYLAYQFFGHPVLALERAVQPASPVTAPGG